MCYKIGSIYTTCLIQWMKSHSDAMQFSVNFVSSSLYAIIITDRLHKVSAWYQ